MAVEDYFKEGIEGSPSRLLLYSEPKVGKTQMAAMLSKRFKFLLFDLEKNGSKSYSAYKKVIQTEGDTPAYKQLSNELRALQEVKKNEGSHGFNGCIIDTSTALEQMLLPAAAALAKQKGLSKNVNANNVLELPHGAGYGQLREVLKGMCNMIENTFEYVVYMGHIRDKTISKNTGEEVSVKDLQMIGQNRVIIAAHHADSLGYVYRKGKKTIVTFKTDSDLIAGSRQKHLSEQEIVVLDSTSGEIKDHWDKIYIDIKE